MCDSMTSSPLSLLNVDPGVEIRIISFVASGDGGLRDVLNLRLVCRTTKSWVDKLPKAQADAVFSKAHVILEFCDKEFSEFLLSPPPFGVTALTLIDADNPKEYQDRTLTRFCEFWNSKIETLDLKNCWTYYEVPLNYRILDLLTSPNLIQIKFERPFLYLFKDAVIPSCFQKVAELHLNLCDPGDFYRNEIFAQLNNNPNLRVLSVDLFSRENAFNLTKLIEKRKNDTGIHFTLGLESYTPYQEREEGHEVFREFVNSIVVSKSKIRLVKIDNLGHFVEFMNEVIPRNEGIELLKRIESVINWQPTEATLSLLESLPGIREAGPINFIGLSIESDRVTFPPYLEKLEFMGKFLACGSLPQSLTSFSFVGLACDINTFSSSLNLLRSRCPQLASLKIFTRYWPSNEERLADNVETTHEFRNLKKLSCNYFVMRAEGSSMESLKIEKYRTAFANLFDFKNLELADLELGIEPIYDSSCNLIPLVDEQILTQIYEGPSAKSLRKIQISNCCVTPKAIPLLEKLRSLAKENLKTLNERQGRMRRPRNKSNQEGL